MKKIFKSVFSVTLCLIMLLGTAAVGDDGFADVSKAISVKASADSYSVGDIIEYGNYPQTAVTDEATIAALNNCDGTWVSYNYYSGDGCLDDNNSEDGKMDASDYMRYKDVSYNGDKYRAVTFDSFRPMYTGLDLSPENSYLYYNGYSTGTVYWFKYEPVRWRVLDPETGLVMCDTVIDSQPYNNYILTDGTACYGEQTKTYYANNYAESSIREWLNDDFYNTAFSAGQKLNILTTTLDNTAWNHSAYDSASTSDKVYLLSKDDACNADYGFSPEEVSKDAARKLKGTDYAKIQGLYSISGGSTEGYFFWNLRTAGEYSCFTCCAGNDGYVYGNVSGTCRTDMGVVPAMNLQTIKCVTTDEPVVQEGNIIAGNPENSQKTYNYKSTVTFNADVPEGGSVQWYLNDQLVGTGSSYTTPQMKSSYTVKVVVTAADGSKSMDTEEVTIKSGIFDKIIAFFILLFNKNAYTYNQK